MDRRSYSGKRVDPIELADDAEEYVADVAAILDEMKKPKGFIRTPEEVMAARRARPACHHMVGPVAVRRDAYADCGERVCQCRVDEFRAFVKDGPTQAQVEAHE